MSSVIHARQVPSRMAALIFIGAVVLWVGGAPALSQELEPTLITEYDCPDGWTISGEGSATECVSADGEVSPPFIFLQHVCPADYVLEFSPLTCVKAHPVQFAEVREALDPGSSWLEAVNWYRRASDLPVVTNNRQWTQGIRNHLNYLVQTDPSLMTGEYANAHHENPASPYYTPEGDEAGRSSNLGYGNATAVDAIDGWMTAPFHAIGVLRRGLEQSAFARDSGSGRAGLDVIRGLTQERAHAPIVFPGYGSTIHLRAFRGENPNPLETCDYTSAGLPLIALLVNPPDERASATLTDSAGRIVPSCLVTEHTYRTTDAVYGPTGRAILAADNAVFVIPRQPLTAPWYSVSIEQPGRADVNWWFSVAEFGQAAETPTIQQQCDIGVTIDMRTGASGAGTAQDDVIIGTPGDDRIWSYGGHDVICALDGRDTVRGGAGDDRIDGGLSIDRLYGQQGADVIEGGGGSDRIFGDSGADVLRAGSGADRVFGGPGHDELFGMGGQDRLYGEDGNDMLQGNWQSDLLFGGSGHDVLRGAQGKDKLFGGEGDDELFGGANTDYLDGGPGHDEADGQRGRDRPFVVDVSGCDAEQTRNC